MHPTWILAQRQWRWLEASGKVTQTLTAEDIIRSDKRPQQVSQNSTSEQHT